MKTIFSLSIPVLLLLLLPGCEQEKEYNLAISGKLVDHSECKGFKSAGSYATTPDNQSCAVFTYDTESSTLLIKHVNAAFNCGADSIYCIVSNDRNSILIEEHERNALTHCNCLYDLDIEIKDLPPGAFIIKFIEPYCGEQETLQFRVDLVREKQGQYCVTRTGYPWGI